MRATISLESKFSWKTEKKTEIYKSVLIHELSQLINSAWNFITKKVRVPNGTYCWENILFWKVCSTNEIKNLSIPMY